MDIVFLGGAVEYPGHVRVAALGSHLAPFCLECRFYTPVETLIDVDASHSARLNTQKPACAH